MKSKLAILMTFLLLQIAFPWGADTSPAQKKSVRGEIQKTQLRAKFELNEQRQAAGRRFRQMRNSAMAAGEVFPNALVPGTVPHYFGPYPNYANSPLPKGGVTSYNVEVGGTGYVAPTATITDLYGTGTGATAAVTAIAGVITAVTMTTAGTGYSTPIVTINDTAGTGAVVTGVISGPFVGGIRKFMEPLPNLVIAVPDTATYSGSDYYEIELGEYDASMSLDLYPTRLRGYRQTNTAGPANAFSYLGPVIVAERDRPVRIKFTNNLPVGSAGNLFLPVDMTVMGAGMGPLLGSELYKENRGSLHLHGNNTVWISDGTPHQWITPAGETTSYPKGVSVRNVPDMPDPGPGSMTLFYTNAHSARLMFYHDHSFGITRLNVYAGEAAGYVVTDQVERDMIDGTNVTGVNPTNLQVLPNLGIPLIIQDKTFVAAQMIGYQDPTWAWGTTPGTAHTGDLWFPHVYMPNQNPGDPSGMNAFGRWHYGPWFWPPTNNVQYGPVANPYFGMDPWEPPMNPGVPEPSMAMEAFMDTPVVNGKCYPYLEVDPKTYRFRILNAADDRFFNLQMYVADDDVSTADGRINTEVKMVPAVATDDFPEGWPVDGREGGVPDPDTIGPQFIQIGTEGGFLPEPTVLPMQPVDWNMDPTNFDMGIVNKMTLMLGVAERADVLVDFSDFAGKTIILYNDCPAPVPALDKRYDYYTGNSDHTDSGGTPPTQPGYGPNTRTIMQFRVAATTPAPAYNLANLMSVFAKTATKRGVFEVSQDEIIFPEARYNSAYNLTFAEDPFVRIFDHTKTFQTVSGATVTNFPLEPKALQDEMGETYDPQYGRMSGNLGLQLPWSPPGAMNFILLPFSSPPVEIVKNTTFGTPIGALTDGTQIWKFTHNGVDTHPIHVHLFNAQVINRVAWDNAVRPPDPNELGWKETFRVNPLQDTIVALRPIISEAAVPFDVPNSVRPIDPTMPIGAVLEGGPGGFKDPLGNPVTIENHLVNFGWEYVYHCHILSHEEMDMMHAMSFVIAPKTPTNLAAVVAGAGASKVVNVTWTDASANETSFTVQRSATTTGPWSTIATLPEGTVAYTDPIGDTTAAYSYRIYASNTVGDTITPGFPTKTADSAFAGPVTIGTGAGTLPTPPTSLTAVSQVGPQVLLTWTDNATDETQFAIERQVGVGPFSTLALVGPTAGTGSTTYTDTTVAVGTTYGYRVAAVNAAGISAYTNTATVSISTAATAPTNVNAYATRKGAGLFARIIMTWTDSPDETGYTIQISTNSKFLRGVVTYNIPANATSWTSGTVARSTNFYVRIRAYNGTGVSAWVRATPWPIITP